MPSIHPPIQHPIRQSILFSLITRLPEVHIRSVILQGRHLACLAAESDDIHLCFVSKRPSEFGMCDIYGVNVIQRHELYVLDDGEKPLTVLEDTKIPNAATIIIVKQDHTLANMLRHQLLANPSVLFAGYKVPHPLQPSFQLKIQTDGTITPAEALERASMDLIDMLGTLETKFRQEFSFRELEGADVGIGLGVGTGAGVSGLGGVGGTGDVGLDGTAGGAYGEGAAWSGRDYLDL